MKTYFSSPANLTPQTYIQVNPYHMGFVTSNIVTCDKNHIPEITTTECDFFSLKEDFKGVQTKLRVCGT